MSSARHAQTGETCAVKKVTNVFTKKVCFVVGRGLTSDPHQALPPRAPSPAPLPRPQEHYLVSWTGFERADGSLYDMDIVFDPPGSGMFNEVYLYEELMEADLHAIVSHCPGAALTPDPLRPAAVGRALPELHLPDAVRVEGALRSRPLLTSVHPLGQRSPPRLKARKPARQRRLRAQDLRLWPRAWLPARCCADRAGAGRLHDRV